MDVQWDAEPQCSAMPSRCSSIPARRTNIAFDTTRSGRSCRRCWANPASRNYSIFLDPDTNTLFAYLERTDDYRVDELTRHSVMRRWWAYMKDIMAADPDGSPVTTPLVEMFHLE